MKKLQLVLILALLFTLSATAAEKEYHPPTARDRAYMLYQMAFSGAISWGIKQYGEKAGADYSARSILQVANALYGLGLFADNPVFKDLAGRALVAGLAVTVGSSALMQDKLVPNLPFVGQELQLAGERGEGMVIIALYSMMAIVYEGAIHIYMNGF